MFRELCVEETYKKYKKYYKKSFVEISKQMKWCPAPNCSYFVDYPSRKQTDIYCNCGSNWCFKCTKPAHRPLPCDLLAKWNDRINSGNDDNDIWIKLNTKACPNCKSNIQKNQGCMHMTCRNCKHEFCWLCMGDYKKHTAETGRSLCNSFDDVANAKVSLE
jgi:ariadne-1